HEPPGENVRHPITGLDADEGDDLWALERRVGDRVLPRLRAGWPRQAARRQKQACRYRRDYPSHGLSPVSKPSRTDGHTMSPMPALLEDRRLAGDNPDTG